MTTTRRYTSKESSRGRADFTVGEVDAILEAAYLATRGRRHSHHRGARSVSHGGGLAAADRHGRRPAKAKPIADKDLDALFARFSVRSDTAERPERVKAVRERLGRKEVRELAYKVAFAMSLCDLDANDEETAYEDELIEAFASTTSGRTRSLPRCTRRSTPIWTATRRPPRDEDPRARSRRADGARRHRVRRQGRPRLQGARRRGSQARHLDGRHVRPRLRRRAAPQGQGRLAPGPASTSAPTSRSRRRSSASSGEMAAPSPRAI